jgi:NADP-dependent 3-hydroxy acid dehydrogenase YdfG
VKPDNIRTTVISPVATATELPNNSVTDPDAAKRIQRFYAKIAIPAESFARAVVFAISQPEDIDVNEILFWPTRQELRAKKLGPGVCMPGRNHVLKDGLIAKSKAG